jgi:hemoglobin
MDSEPAYRGIRQLHPPALDGSTEKLYLFLSGWMGGPQLYVEKFGHPMLRARHLPFSIGESERDQWLACMQRAMEDCAVPELLRLQLMGAFGQTADWMRNQPA